MKGWAILLAAGTSAAAAEDERKILYHVNENPYVRVEAIVIEGRLCAERYSAIDCNRPVRISIQRKGELLEINASAGQQSYGVELPLARLPELDLQSAKISGHYRPNALVLVDLRFGEPSDCFINDDGRSRLSVSLGEESGAQAWITTHDDCEIQGE